MPRETPQDAKQQLDTVLTMLLVALTRRQWRCVALCEGGCRLVAAAATDTSVLLLRVGTVIEWNSSLLL